MPAHRLPTDLSYCRFPDSGTLFFRASSNSHLIKWGAGDARVPIQLLKDVTYEDTAAVLVGTVPAGCRLLRTTVKFDTAFDTGSATIGDGTTVDRFAAASDMSLTDADYVMSIASMEKMSVDTNVYWYPSIAGATQGAGVVMIEYV